MGRWGTRLFEGNKGLDMVRDLQKILEADGLKLEEYYSEDQQQLVIDNLAKLDSGLGNKWMAKLQANESQFVGEYLVILFGVLLMCCGANISNEHIQHLRDLVPRINCNDGFTSPLADDGFRRQGKMQFLAALDHYKPGVPRIFAGSSCFWCGKVKGDIGRTLMQCGRCKFAWYCGKGCQRAHWRAHKPNCHIPGTRMLLNF